MIRTIFILCAQKYFTECQLFYVLICFLLPFYFRSFRHSCCRSSASMMRRSKRSTRPWPSGSRPARTSRGWRRRGTRRCRSVFIFFCQPGEKRKKEKMPQKSSKLFLENLVLRFWQLLFNYLCNNQLFVNVGFKKV